MKRIRFALFYLVFSAFSKIGLGADLRIGIMTSNFWDIKNESSIEAVLHCRCNNDQKFLYTKLNVTESYRQRNNIYETGTYPKAGDLLTCQVRLLNGRGAEFQFNCSQDGEVVEVKIKDDAVTILETTPQVVYPPSPIIHGSLIKEHRAILLDYPNLNESLWSRWAITNNSSKEASIHCLEGGKEILSKDVLKSGDIYFHQFDKQNGGYPKNETKLTCFFQLANGKKAGIDFKALGEGMNLELSIKDDLVDISEFSTTPLTSRISEQHFGVYLQ